MWQAKKEADALGMTIVDYLSAPAEVTQPLLHLLSEEARFKAWQDQPMEK